MTITWSPAAALLVLAIFHGCSAQRDDYCLSSDSDPYLRFSTKTAYEFIKGRETSQHIVPSCKPVQFWSFNRYGSRLPGVKGIEELSRLGKIRDEIIANYEVKRNAPSQGRLCSQDIENLKNWVWNRNFTANYAKDLTSQGYEDLKFMAKRWQTKFPELFPAYAEKDYIFQYTDKRRTKDSFRAFADGLFGRNVLQQINPLPVVPNNTLLEPYEFCMNWINDVKNNPDTLQQMDQFQKKEEYKTMIKNVSSHLGYKYDQDENVINNIYDMCRYDKSWEINKNSPWCAAFNPDQLRLIEYSYDLKTYYMGGYGTKMNKQLGCSPIKDMMKKFTDMVEKPDSPHPKATVYFSHSQMLEMLVTAFGIKEDHVPLTADNYHTPSIQRRQWKSSNIDPFASNIVSVLYKCDQGEQNRVMMFLNEVPVDFNGCSVGLCSWEWIKNKYSKLADECNMKICSNNSADSVGFYKVYILLATVLTWLTAKTSFI